jgi:hypothetical protein
MYLYDRASCTVHMINTLLILRAYPSEVDTVFTGDVFTGGVGARDVVRRRHWSVARATHALVAVAAFHTRGDACQAAYSVGPDPMPSDRSR